MKWRSKAEPAEMESKNKKSLVYQCLVGLPAVDVLSRGSKVIEECGRTLNDSEEVANECGQCFPKAWL